MNQEVSPQDREGWLTAFLREVFSMPRRHLAVFLIATVLLVLVEVQLLEGWRLIHLVELVGVMVFLYLMWAAWRVRCHRMNG